MAMYGNIVKDVHVPYTHGEIQYIDGILDMGQIKQGDSLMVCFMIQDQIYMYSNRQTWIS